MHVSHLCRSQYLVGIFIRVFNEVRGSLRGVEEKGGANGVEKTDEKLSHG